MKMVEIKPDVVGMYAPLQAVIADAPTDFLFDGQRYEEELGLYYFNSRWYDPVLGRFIQPDTVIPEQSQGTQAWDRYAFVNNNPVVYNDPTGHCIACLVGFAIYTLPHIMGWLPDYRGIRIAEANMDPANASIAVAAGIAVQSEWYGPWDTRALAPNESSGLGIAGVSDVQMNTPIEAGGYGLEGLDQEDPQVAIQAMAIRIQLVRDECTGCSARDKLISAALAQNGPGFTADSMKFVLNKFTADGVIDWNRYFNSRNPKSNLLDLRAMGHHQYDTRFMLYLYIKDLSELYRRGWNLPPGITEADLDYMEDISWSN